VQSFDESRNLTIFSVDLPINITGDANPTAPQTSDNATQAPTPEAANSSKTITIVIEFTYDSKESLLCVCLFCSI
jgi:hypothetical protein